MELDRIKGDIQGGKAMQGIFITFEGPDGAGKTSVIESLVPLLRDEFVMDIVETREPGGIAIAEDIRHLILDNKNQMMDERTEALLYAASRRQHLVEKIFPALSAGKCVICDRFVDSSLAYQGKGRRIGMEEIAKMNEFATEGITPDLTLYLDIDAETGMQRIRKNLNQFDRLENAGIEFHQRVRHGYLELAKQYPERIVTIDAKQSLEQVIQDCYDTIAERFPRLFRNY